MNNENSIADTAAKAKDAAPEQTVFISDYQKQLMSDWTKSHTRTGNDGVETCPPAPVQVVGNSVRWVNRKERRMHQALSRRAPDPRKPYDIQRAILGALKAMAESPLVQNKVLSGALDAWLPQAQETIEETVTPTPAPEQA